MEGAPRLLWLTIEPPWPPVTGGQLRTAGLLAALAGQYRITMIVLNGRLPDERGPLSRIDWLGCPATTAAKAVMAAALPLRGRPPYLRHFQSGRQRRFVAQVLGSRSFAAVISETPYAAGLFPDGDVAGSSGGRGSQDEGDSPDQASSQAGTQGRPPLIVNTHNVEAEVWRSAGPAADGSRFLVALDRRLVPGWEENTLARAAGRAYCSARDRDLLEPVIDRRRALQSWAAARDAHAVVVPNAVDTEAIRPLPAPPDRRQVLFLGGLRYGPNAEAARFIVSSLAPLLAGAGLSAAIAGGNAADLSITPVPPSVRFLGRVNDPRPAYQDSFAMIVPLSSGSGTRLKVLESFAYGRPVVSTGKGVEGLEVEPEEHYLAAEDAEQFTTQLLRLRTDVRLGAGLVARARDFVERRHSWPVAGAAMAGLIDAVTAGRH